MTSSSRSKRLLTCAFALALVWSAVLSINAGAANLQKAQKGLEAAKAQAARLGNEISRGKARLAVLEGVIGGLEGEIALAQSEYDRIALKLDQTQQYLGQTQGKYDEIKATMNTRAAATYMQGAGNDLAFLLSATSLSDLSDRVEFINALQSQDADRAAELTSLSRLLNDTRKRESNLAHVSRDALQELQKRKAELDARKAEAQAALSDLNAKLAEAKRLEEKWSHKVKVIIRATGGTGGPSPFDVCPVPGFSWIADDFGAIRYTTIPPHSHQGNDIGAPYGSPIVAPFTGNATDSSNSLGGLSVSISGAEGYVYNAHLSKMGKLGKVQPGDIVGYVGMSGDAQGTVPHDHFEWHPGGGSAVDPHAFLLAVC